MANPLDPRVRSLFRSQPNILKFIAVALVVLLGDKLNQVFEYLKDQGADMNGFAAGKPFVHFTGKTPAEIRREGFNEEQMAEIRRAFELRNMAWEEEIPAEVVNDPLAGTGEAVQLGGPGEPVKRVDEPTFGMDKIKLSLLKDKTDKELLAIPGISKATIKEIRKAAESV